MIRVHKIALDPNNEQRSYFARACGTARFAWNWALGEWIRQYRQGGKPSEAALRRQLNAIKRTEFPWMLEVSKTAPQEAIKQLGFAFKRFFRGEGGYPRFKRKGQRDSYQADNGPGTFAIEGTVVRHCDGRTPVVRHCGGQPAHIRLPVIGRVRMREALRFQGELRSVTISRTAGKWFAAVAVEVPEPDPEPEPRPEAIVGVDLGVKALATLSDGTVVEGPKAHRHYLRRLRRLNRSLARKTEAAKAAMGLAGKAVPKGVRIPASNNRKKAAAQLARLHARIAAIRQDALHKLTTDLTRRFTVIGIEDLNVRGMLANDRLSRAIADMGFHEFRRQLEYKARRNGVTVVVAPRFHPSSKTCSSCGHVLEALQLKTRAWDCPVCAVHHDRDLNAARNLARLCETRGPAAGEAKLTCTASSAGIQACGGAGSDLGSKAKVKPAPRKQEPNSSQPCSDLSNFG